MKTYRINQVAKMTGLSKEVLRVWEKRYRLVFPQRGANRYRLYSEEDVKLLQYLVKEIDQGQSIGELASLGREEIAARIDAEENEKVEATNNGPDPLIRDLERCLMPLDRVAFDQKLQEMISLLPFEEVFKRVLIPLQIRTGELWFEGKIGIAVEHYVTTQVKQKLFAVMNMLGNQEGPQVVIACPPWEPHEIGAQMVAYHCSTLKCQAILLGANLPLQDLIDFCTRDNPDAVVLSFTSPVSEKKARVFFAELSSQISPICPVWAGGQALVGMESLFQKPNFKIVNELSSLNTLLNELESK